MYLLQVLVCLVVFSVIAAKKDVLVLNDKNFKSTILKHKYTLVMFYAPWCGYCKNLMPHFKEAARILAKGKPPTTLAKIDCTEEGVATCEDFSISGFPTLKLFRNGEYSQEYGGARNTEGIVEFMQGKLESNSNDELGEVCPYITDTKKKSKHNARGSVSKKELGTADMLASDYQKQLESLSSEFTKKLKSLETDDRLYGGSASKKKFKRGGGNDYYSSRDNEFESVKGDWSSVKDNGSDFKKKSGKHSSSDSKRKLYGNYEGSTSEEEFTSGKGCNQESASKKRLESSGGGSGYVSAYEKKLKSGGGYSGGRASMEELGGNYGGSTYKEESNSGEGLTGYTSVFKKLKSTKGQSDGQAAKEKVSGNYEGSTRKSGRGNNYDSAIEKRLESDEYNSGYENDSIEGHSGGRGSKDNGGSTYKKKLKLGGGQSGYTSAYEKEVDSEESHSGGYGGSYYGNGGSGRHSSTYKQESKYGRSDPAVKKSSGSSSAFKKEYRSSVEDMDYGSASKEDHGQEFMCANKSDSKKSKKGSKKGRKSDDDDNDGICTPTRAKDVLKYVENMFDKAEKEDRKLHKSRKAKY